MEPAIQGELNFGQEVKSHNSHTTAVSNGDKQISETRITREIGIDMGHRVTNHGSKCRNMHGHRYKIVVHCVGGIQPTGESNPQEGMLVDFGFLKDEMMQCIDQWFDHGTCLWRQDPLVIATLSNEQINAADEGIQSGGFCVFTRQQFWGKLAVVPFVPTAENLAKFWADLLAPRVVERSNGFAKLCQVDVWETPACCASYEVI